MPGAVCVRVDGGGALGFGHLVRCAALAAAVEEAGGHVRWAARRDPAVERFVPRIWERPGTLEVAGAPGFDELGPAEAATVGRWARDAAWLVVDHYGAGDAWLEAARAAGARRIVVFDDHQRRAAADLRIAPFQLEAEDGVLAGPSFAVLRSAFGARREAPPAPGPWVVSFGGADRRLAGEALARWIESGEAHDLVVLASDAAAEAQRVDELLERWPGSAERIAWLEADALAALLRRASAAAVGCSNAALEALAVGCPTVAVAWADNHEPVARLLRAHRVPVARDGREAAALMALGAASVGEPAGWIDGHGAARVARALLADSGGDHE